MARRYYSSTAARTTLASGVDDTTTTLSVVAVSGWPASFPYTLVIDQDTINEELVEVSARSGTTLTVTRGVDGTSAVAHDAGAAVNHGVSARDFDEPNAFINGTDYVDTDGGSTVTASGASVVPLTLKGASGQTANLLSFLNNNNAAVAHITEDGVLQIFPATGLPALQAYRDDTDEFGAGLDLHKSQGTAIVNVNDDLGYVRFYGYDGSTYREAARITAEVDGTPGASDMPGRLLFSTTPDGSTSITERMRIKENGSILIGTTTSGSAGAGDLVVNGGVFLGGSAAANELNDYEEGTWTPEYTFGTSGSVTHDIQSGDYMRINNKVFIWARLRTDAISSPTGSVRVSGLPFNTSATISFNYGMGGVVTYAASFGGDRPSSISADDPSADYVFLRFRGSASGDTNALQGSDMGSGANNNDLQFNAWYWAV